MCVCLETSRYSNPDPTDSKHTYKHGNRWTLLILLHPDSLPCHFQCFSFLFLTNPVAFDSRDNGTAAVVVVVVVIVIVVVAIIIKL